MNDLVEAKIKPVLEKAINDLDAEIIRASEAVTAWEKRWGNVPDQPFLKKSVQDRIKKLIRGENVADPTGLELQMAGNRLDAVLKVLDLK